jgi:uncharacterized protein (DUF1499 family)
MTSGIWTRYRRTGSTRIVRASALVAVLAGCHGSRPTALGLTAGVLRPCARVTNCVNSEAGTPDPAHVESFAAPDGRMSFARLRAALDAMPRTEIVTASDSYLHVEATSLLMRFIDDVELRYDSTAAVIHVRSASRLGRKDFGVNRERVDALRVRYLSAK